MHSVDGILEGYGNSYANSWTVQWLTHAKSLGAYHRHTVGRITELMEEWEFWIAENGGLPHLPKFKNKDC